MIYSLNTESNITTTIVSTTEYINTTQFVTTTHTNTTSLTTASPTKSPITNKSDHSDEGWVIGEIIFGVLLGIVLIAGFIACIIFKRRENEQNQSSKDLRAYTIMNETGNAENESIMNDKTYHI